MAGDTTYRNFVGALWSLIGAARDHDGRHVEAAANLAAGAFAAARGDDSYVMLHEQDGAIHVNGRRLALGVDVFAAAHGLASLLHGRGIGEVLFDASVDAAALVAWARCWSAEPALPVDPEAELVRSGAGGVHASRRPEDAGAPAGLRRRSGRREAPDSRLRSVFLLHHLVASVPAGGLLPPTPAKVVVEAVAERLLGIDGGLDPLLLLQRDDALLRRSLHVAVVAAAVARAAGFDESRLADIGAAALLHDVGAVIDPAQPAASGFRWLLARGGDDFWLRCAIVARTWREEHGAAVERLDPGSAVPALVRLAVAMEREWCVAPAAPSIAQPLRRAAAAGAFPREFVEAALVACAIG